MYTTATITVRNIVHGALTQSFSCNPVYTAKSFIFNSVDIFIGKMIITPGDLVFKTKICVEYLTSPMCK